MAEEIVGQFEGAVGNLVAKTDAVSEKFAELGALVKQQNSIGYKALVFENRKITAIEKAEAAKVKFAESVFGKGVARFKKLNTMQAKLAQSEEGRKRAEIKEKERLDKFYQTEFGKGVKVMKDRFNEMKAQLIKRKSIDERTMTQEEIRAKVNEKLQGDQMTGRMKLFRRQQELEQEKIQKAKQFQEKVKYLSAEEVKEKQNIVKSTQKQIKELEKELDATKLGENTDDLKQKLYDLTQQAEENENAIAANESVRNESEKRGYEFQSETFQIIKDGLMAPFLVAKDIFIGFRDLGKDVLKAGKAAFKFAKMVRNFEYKEFFKKKKEMIEERALRLKMFLQQKKQFVMDKAALALKKMQLLVDKIALLMNPYVLLGVAVIALIAGLVMMKDEIIAFFTETIPQAFDSFVEMIANIPSKIGKFFSELFDDIYMSIPSWLGGPDDEEKAEIMKERQAEELKEKMLNIEKEKGDLKGPDGSDVGNKPIIVQTNQNTNAPIASNRTIVRPSTGNPNPVANTLATAV